jgi:NTE family protein
MSPVHASPGDDETKLEDGLALCLLVGGYRAMVFHFGVLWRLNETGLLKQLNRISTVSGGSITAGVLAKNGSKLDFKDGIARNFIDVFVNDVQRMARTSGDLRAVALGALLPGQSICDRMARAYREHLFGNTALQQLPDNPRFVLNATNLECGVLCRIGKPYLGDHRVGRILEPDIHLALAVAASSAFPPVLSPCPLNLNDQVWTTDRGNDLTEPDYRNEIKLTDGGVYDNLGVETAWKRYKTILVSEAGGHVEDQPDPAADWARQTARGLSLSTAKSERCASVRSSSRSGPGCSSESAAA